MTLRSKYGENWMSVEDKTPLIKVYYFPNRFHFNPGIYRLTFEVHESLAIDKLQRAIPHLLVELRRQLPSTAFLCRTTLEDSSPLVPLLKGNGFIGTRFVHEPLLDISDAQGRGEGHLDVDNSDYELHPLKGEQLHDPSFRMLHAEVYARSSRLDPATPDKITDEEWLGVISDDLILEESVSLVVQGELAGMALVYSDEYEPETTCQLGLIGVRQDLLVRRRTLTAAMVQKVIGRVEQRGLRYLRAEIDSDDPWVVYTCAAFPFRADKTMISLAWPLAWV